MAEVHPFKGWRYDISQVGSLAEVTAPPYDVIGPQAQKELYEQHPCNVVRVILNRDEPGDESTVARYQRAANFLKHWQSDGILMKEREDAFYVYHQEFNWEGTHYLRKGFLGRLKIEEFGNGKVYPHEQTMSGPKADRLALTKACKMNLSPIFGLYPDNHAAVQTPLEQVVAGQTPLEVTDADDVIHRFWPVTDPTVLNQVRSALNEKPIFIADGHHRYETASNYRNELRTAGKIDENKHPANFVLMMFVGMSDPGLAILPTHRLVSGFPSMNTNDVRDALSNHFEVEEIESENAATDIWEMMQADGGQDIFGFGTPEDGKWIFAQVTDNSPMQTIAPDQSDAWRQLGVSLLHKMVIEHLLKKKYPHSEPICKYVHLLDEVNSTMSEKSCQLVALVAPAQIEDVEEVSLKFEKMPAKSTFFYPKLLSGLVFNPLE